jgi:hypothetical protein
MEIGAIGYHDLSKVHTIRVEKDNAIVKEINKTKEVRILLVFLSSVKYVSLTIFL